MSDDSYLAYFEEAKDAAQQRIWTFYKAIIIVSLHYTFNRSLHDAQTFF